MITGDENKVTLLAIEGILERLLVLVHHDEPIIRRNSCMALASLSRLGIEVLGLFSFELRDESELLSAVRIDRWCASEWLIGITSLVEDDLIK